MNIVQNRKQAKTVGIKTKRRTEERLKQQLKKKRKFNNKAYYCLLYTLQYSVVQIASFNQLNYK